jgi:hypothetical protein
VPAEFGSCVHRRNHLAVSVSPNDRFPAPPNSRSPIKRRGLIDNAVADGLLALDWPDEQQTPLRRFASEEQIRRVFDQAYRALDALGLARAATG